MDNTYKSIETPGKNYKIHENMGPYDTGAYVVTDYDIRICKSLQNDILSTDLCHFDANRYVNDVVSIIEMVEKSSGKLISYFSQKELGEKLVEIITYAKEAEIVSRTLALTVELMQFSDEILIFFYKTGVFNFVTNMFLNCDDHELIYYCLKIFNTCIKLIDVVNLRMVIKSFNRFCLCSDAIEFQTVQAIFLIITFIDFSNEIDSLLDLVYKILKNSKSDESKSLLMECLNLLIHCDDRYFKRMLQRKVISRIVKIFNNENHIETNSGFIIPFLKFLSHSIYILNELEISNFLSKIALGPGMQNLFKNEKISGIKVWILDIYQQIIQKEIDMELHYTELMKYLIENNFIQELFEIFVNCTFEFKAKIIDFLRLLMSTKYEAVYSLLVSHNENYFNVCSQFCLSSTNYEIMKNFLETIICIIDVSENLDEKDQILEMMEEEKINDQLEEYVNNKNEMEIMKLSEQYFNQVTCD